MPGEEERTRDLGSLIHEAFQQWGIQREAPHELREEAEEIKARAESILNAVAMLLTHEYNVRKLRANQSARQVIEISASVLRKLGLSRETGPRLHGRHCALAEK